MPTSADPIDHHIASAEPEPVAAAHRFDFYADIHKALRACMSETLVLLGRADADDPDDTRAALAMVRDLLALCASHVDKENRYVHPAIEARAAGCSSRIADEHDDHLQALADLEEDVQVVELASSRTRDAALLCLYHRLSSFVAGNYAHMLVEEIEHNAALWAHYTDAELIVLHDALLASVPPAEMTTILRWMVPSITPTARARWFAAMKPSMPPEAFDGVLGHVKSTLAPADAAKLDRALRAMA